MCRVLIGSELHLDIRKGCVQRRQWAGGCSTPHRDMPLQGCERSPIFRPGGAARRMRADRWRALTRIKAFRSAAKADLAQILARPLDNSRADTLVLKRVPDLSDKLLGSERFREVPLAAQFGIRDTSG